MSKKDSTARVPESTGTPTQAESLDQALRLAARGWRLHPLTSTRIPFVSGWPDAASADPEQIRAWAQEYPDCNWGVATGPESGVFVLDADGLAGINALDKWQKRHGDEWKNTLTVHTANGEHLYFKYPDKQAVRNTAGDIAKGIDIRGEGGYAVVPLSIHEDGPVYRWGTSEDAPILDAPAWLLKEIRKASRSKKKSEIQDGPIGEGQRNSALASLAGSMRRRGMTLDAINAALQMENTNKCEPPLPPDEVRKIAESVSSYLPTVDDEPMPSEFSDDALALAFTERHGPDLRYTALWGHWSHWDGKVWRKEETLLVFDLSRDLCREVSVLAPENLAPRIASSRAIAAIVKLASAARRHVASTDQWDRDLWKLNTPAGLIDLKTGDILPHNREFYCTKITAVAPSGDCPLWRKFLDRITAGNVELQNFLQRVCGYCLTGVTTEHALFFLYGTGALVFLSENLFEPIRLTVSKRFIRDPGRMTDDEVLQACVAP